MDNERNGEGKKLNRRDFLRSLAGFAASAVLGGSASPAVAQTQDRLRPPKKSVTSPTIKLEDGVHSVLVGVEDKVECSTAPLLEQGERFDQITDDGKGVVVQQQSVPGDGQGNCASGEYKNTTRTLPVGPRQ